MNLPIQWMLIIYEMIHASLFTYKTIWLSFTIFGGLLSQLRNNNLSKVYFSENILMVCGSPIKSNAITKYKTKCQRFHFKLWNCDTLKFISKMLRTLLFFGERFRLVVSYPDEILCEKFKLFLKLKWICFQN